MNSPKSASLPCRDFSSTMPGMRATRAIIYLSNIRSNIRAIRAHVGKSVKICIAVKADGYGHGAVEVAKVAVSEGIEFLGVATLSEAAELRQAGIRIPVILLSLCVPDEIRDIVALDVLPVVASADLADLFAAESGRQGKKTGCHLKIDTGMGRIGCTPEEAPALAEKIAVNPSLSLAGVCTHFPGSDLSDKSFTNGQIRRFSRAVDAIRARGIDPGLIHAANSGAINEIPESYFNLVRPGIMVYGYYPSREQSRALALKPAMEFRTRVVFLKKVGKGTPISYGMTYRAPEDAWIATLPVGYADGYNRLLSNRGRVAINGMIYPVVGRICMDQCLVNLGSQTDVRLYDDAVLFGPEPPAKSAEEIADQLETISYEVTCLVGKRVPRIFIKDESP
jgi:alanine racemase